MNFSPAFTLLAVCAIGLRAAPAPARPTAEPVRPNVVLFLIDDQGYGDLGCHGNPKVRTPSMDAFARQSVELTQFYSMPVCSPTRAALMTGRYHMRTGVTDVFRPSYEMKTEEVTVAEALRDAGYATGLFGKWHLGETAGHRPNDQGFQESLTHETPAMRQYFDPTLLENGVPKQFRGYCMDIFTDQAIAFMRRHRDRPFFVYLPTNLIHSPLQVADELVEPYAQAGLDERTSKVWAMLQSVDTNFGRLLAVLKELGLEENTLVLLTSDNGSCSDSTTTQRFMAGLRGLKGTPYEGGIRVPTFARWPGKLRAGATASGLGTVMDVMPTLLDACGIPKPAGVQWDGVSLMPLLRNPASAWPDRTVVFQWDGHPVPQRGRCFAVRSGRYKLVQATGLVDDPRQKHILATYATITTAQGRGPLTIEGEPRYELFDIAADPGERKDLAAEHPEIVAKLRSQYDEWFDDVWTSWHPTNQLGH